jgi:hypothetical protein
MHLRGVANHRGLAWLLVAWLSTMAITSAFVYLAENGVNKLMASPFDALWWGVTTLTTVGYGDTYPVTPEGRLAAMVLMLLGITLFAGITASITSYFVSQSQGGGGTHSSIAEELRSLADLRSDGALTEDEFTAAKMAILRGGLPRAKPRRISTPSRAKVGSAQGGREHRRRAHLTMREPRSAGSNAGMAPHGRARLVPHIGFRVKRLIRLSRVQPVPRRDTRDT